MAGPNPIERCSTHPQAEAAWRCSGCGKLLCPDCAVDASRVNVKLVACIHCGSMAETLRVQRVKRSWTSMLPTFLKAIVMPRALLQYLVVSIIMCVGMLAGMLPFVGWILALLLMFGAWGSYLFAILRAAADGATELPDLKGIGGTGTDILQTFFRLALATAAVWLPLVIYFWNHPFGAAHAVGLISQANWSDTFVLAVQLFGMIYLPAAFILAAMADDAFDVINPFKVFAVIGRLPGQYFALAGIVVGLYVANKLLEFGLYLGMFGVVMGGGIGFVKLLGMVCIIQALLLPLPALSALMLGRFMYFNAESFGYATSANAIREAVPGAVPRGRMPAQGQAPDPASGPAPAGFGPAGNAGVGAAAPAPPPQPVALELESTPQEALVGALKSGHDGMALNAYRKMVAAGQTPQLGPDQELELAKILDTAGDAMGAVHACRRAAQVDMRGPDAPRALFLAASLLIEKAGAPGDGRALLEYLVKNYPGDPWAERAARSLQG